MPIYEFRCRSCGRPFSLFTKSVYEEVNPVCPGCGSRNAERLVSLFAHHKSLKTIHEEAGPPPKVPTLDYYKDPRNIGRYVEETFARHNLEMPRQLRETIQAAREGQLPPGLD